MKIIIDTNKRSIEVPGELREAYIKQVKVDKMLGEESKSILDLINIKDYKIIEKRIVKIKDTTNKETIENFMNNVKNTDKDKYEEYVALRDKIIGKTKNGKPKKTNFLTIKKWFYENYPSENPFKK